MKHCFIISTALAFLVGCTGVPTQFTRLETPPIIFPDYTDVVIPSNIAPLNFRIEEKGDKYVTVITSGSGKTVIRGEKVIIPAKKWEELKKNGQMAVQVYVMGKSGWQGYRQFTITPSDVIDPYISYRVIMPSVECYERLSINQRNLTSFKEKVIYANQMVQNGKNGQCINCHHYRNYTTDNMQFHLRQYLGGTILVTDGQMHKINLKTDSTISAGVYPAWHPTHDYIAYSTNKTHQSIHTLDHNRIEVADEESDLILYDIKNGAVSIIENDSLKFECFPAWSPDGHMLYYVSADYDSPFDSERRDKVFLDSREIRYDIYRKPFDPETRTWGKSEPVFMASNDKLSATLPRVSPDGQWLLFSAAPYGIFHIWHRESELWIMNLKDGSARCAEELNSPEVESYHSWSSNGKWVLFSTRREDGAFTRLYLAHFNDDGSFSKPFALPQRDPDFNRSFMYSFNIPEFMIEPVHITPRQFASFISSTEATPSRYESKKGQ